MRPRLGHGLAVATALLWGTLPIAVKVALKGLHPFTLSAGRFVIAGAVLVAVMARYRPKTLEILRDPPLLVIPVALALAGNYVIYAVGLDLTTASAAQIVVQMSSVFLVIWGITLFGEDLTLRRGVGAFAAFAGVFVVTWNGEPIRQILASRYVIGNALVVLAAFVWSLYATGQKQLNRDHTSYQVLVMVYIASAIVLAGPAVVEAPDAVGWVPLAALAYLGLNTLAAYGAFGEALKHADAASVAVIITLTPVFTILFVHLVNTFAVGLIPPEEITLFTLGGAALVVGGVSLVASERGAEKPETEVPA